MPSTSSSLLLLLSLLVFESSSMQQVPFEVHARNPIGTNQIINPWIKPWIKVFDMVKQDTKELEFADKVGKEPEEDYSLSSSRSIIDLFKPARRVKSNKKPKPVLQYLFDPFLKSLDEFDRHTKDLRRFGSSTTFATAISPKNDLFANALLFSESTIPQNQNAVRISSLAKNAPLNRQTKSTTATPSILTLLESFGHNQKRREEVEIGRDQTVNVLGMPVGRKDGISLAPLRGLSVGNEDMFGPIAINNKYNINWGFFNDLSKMFSQPMRQLTTNTAIVPFQ